MMTSRYYIERTAVKALRKYKKSYAALETGRLSLNTKLTLYKTLIMSVMTYACSTWNYAAVADGLKL
jgi:prefoldin subunit 5